MKTFIAILAVCSVLSVTAAYKPYCPYNKPDCSLVRCALPLCPEGVKYHYPRCSCCPVCGGGYGDKCGGTYGNCRPGLICYRPLCKWHLSVLKPGVCIYEYSYSFQSITPCYLDFALP
uniref:serine protease HTR4-like n=1 Tax=Styela clava TaxID=7725 RepID=UPI0019394BD0|nr:serine protease HTR4-like [Styela clava]